MTIFAETPNPSASLANLRSWMLALVASLGVALLIVAPFFWRGNASGHDIAFHASSWLDAAAQWKQGIVYPRWSEWANYGFGEPRFVFYPPLSWMLGAALSLVAPGNAVPGVFIVLVQTAAGISMFGLARRFFPPSAAIFAAACYAANPYALLIIYMRSDFAELLAAVFYPALLLAALELSGLIENRGRAWPRTLASFAALFAAVWLSNAPAGVMASYGMALLFAWAALREKSLQPLLPGAAGLVFGFGLTCFYLVPAAYEQRWVNIVQALSSGLRPLQNFLYTAISDPEHNLFNWIASSVAILLIALTGIAAFLGRRSMQEGAALEEMKEVWGVLLLLSGAATLLMLRPSAIFWEYLPELRFIQFPWRWLGILAAPYACFAAAAMERRRATWIWAAVVVLATAGTGFYLVQKAWWDSQDIPVLQEAIANGLGFEGTDEYDPAGDDHTDLPQKAPLVRILPSKEPSLPAAKTEVRIERWTAEEKVIQITSHATVLMALRLLAYPAWQVEVDGKSVTPQRSGTTAQMLLSASPGTHRILVRFTRTPDRLWGPGVTLATVLVLGFLTWLAPPNPKQSC